MKNQITGRGGSRTARTTRSARILCTITGICLAIALWALYLLAFAAFELLTDAPASRIPVSTFEIGGN